MDWFLYGLAVLIVIGNVAQVNHIGKPTKPVEAKVVAGRILIAIGIACGLVVAAAR